MTKKIKIIAASILLLILISAGLFYYVSTVKATMEARVASVAYKLAGFKDKERFKELFKYSVSFNTSLQPVMSDVNLPIKITSQRSPFLVNIKQITLKDSGVPDFDVEIKGISINKGSLYKALDPYPAKTLKIIIEANKNQDPIIMDLNLSSDCSSSKCKLLFKSKIPNVLDMSFNLKVSKASSLITRLSSSEIVDAFSGITRSKMIESHANLLDYLVSSSDKSTKSFLKEFKEDKYATAVIRLYDGFFISGDTSLVIKVDDKGLKKSILKGFRQSQNLPNRFIKVLNKIEQGTMSFELKARHSSESSSTHIEVLTPFVQFDSGMSFETKGHIQIANLITNRALSSSARMASLISKIMNFSFNVNLADNQALSNINKKFLSGIIGKYISKQASKNGATVALMLNHEFKNTPNLLSFKAKMKRGELESKFILKGPLANINIEKSFVFNQQKLNNGYSPYHSLDFRLAEININNDKLADLIMGLRFPMEENLPKIRARASKEIETEIIHLKKNINTILKDDIIDILLTATGVESTDIFLDNLQKFSKNPGSISIKIKPLSAISVSKILQSDGAGLLEMLTELSDNELEVELKEKK